MDHNTDADMETEVFGIKNPLAGVAKTLTGMRHGANAAKNDVDTNLKEIKKDLEKVVSYCNTLQQMHAAKDADLKLKVANIKSEVSHTIESVNTAISSLTKEDA